MDVSSLIYTRKENQFRIEQDDYVFTGVRLDPYGFWTVDGRKGKTKIPFDGQFTSADAAMNAVKSKMNKMSVSNEVKL